MSDNLAPLRRVLQQYWGYDSFRPLQAEAMQRVLENRDSVVILPTGGGKSLCFQAPALCRPGLGVVVSPLISLMKDQVDALRESGVDAAFVNSTQTPGEQREVADAIRQGRLKLLYVSPERLVTARMLSFLKDTPLAFFAIDEAHCISSWGHDFRPEYRAMRMLKEQFPEVGVHAYTATATERVRTDIAKELHLQDPALLVGSFDRPNLTFRVEQRNDLQRQIREVLARHAGEAGIIYCTRRADVDKLAETLNGLGHKALPYHAGLLDQERQRNQEAFIQERCDLIVATVAFGMGIDKSNVRFVVHAGAPKSLEAYQQESGRAGRDGLEAECVLLYSGADFAFWRKMQGELPPEAFQAAVQTLQALEGYCTGAICRHRMLVRYFGQDLDRESCGACDICLKEVDEVTDPLIIAQKILSCVVRLNQNFGAEYTSLVLAGSKDQRILQNRHDQLSTYGLFEKENRTAVRSWIEQLAGQGYLQKQGEFNVLQVTPAGRSVLKGETTPRLLQPALPQKQRSKTSEVSWEGVDRELFDQLRSLRREKAAERGVAAFIVFGDSSLRDMARKRPTTLEGFRQVQGVGAKKAADYGTEFLAVIKDYCEEHGLKTNCGLSAASPRASRDDEEGGAGGRSTTAKKRAWQLFGEGKSLDDVQAAVGRARTTICEYLTEFLIEEGISDVSPWVASSVVSRVHSAAAEVGDGKLKPIFEALGGGVSYDEIRISLAALRSAGA